MARVHTQRDARTHQDAHQELKDPLPLPRVRLQGVVKQLLLLLLARGFVDGELYFFWYGRWSCYRYTKDKARASHSTHTRTYPRQKELQVQQPPGGRGRVRHTLQRERERELVPVLQAQHPVLDARVRELGRDALPQDQGGVDGVVQLLCVNVWVVRRR
jgi:hypothetical protein